MDVKKNDDTSVLSSYSNFVRTVFIYLAILRCNKKDADWSCTESGWMSLSLLLSVPLILLYAFVFSSEVTFVAPLSTLLRE